MKEMWDGYQGLFRSVLDLLIMDAETPYHNLMWIQPCPSHPTQIWAVASLCVLSTDLDSFRLLIFFTVNYRFPKYILIYEDKG